MNLAEAVKRSRKGNFFFSREVDDEVLNVMWVDIEGNLVHKSFNTHRRMEYIPWHPTAEDILADDYHEVEKDRWNLPESEYTP